MDDYRRIFVNVDRCELVNSVLDRPRYWDRVLFLGFFLQRIIIIIIILRGWVILFDELIIWIVLQEDFLSSSLVLSPFEKEMIKENLF